MHRYLMIAAGLFAWTAATSWVCAFVALNFGAWAAPVFLAAIVGGYLILARGFDWAYEGERRSWR